MMLLPRPVKVHVATARCNLRKSFDGLCKRGTRRAGQGRAVGARLCVPHMRRSQVKLLLWTRGGFTIVHKRLERATFAFVSRVTVGAQSVEIDEAQQRDSTGDRHELRQAVCHLGRRSHLRTLSRASAMLQWLAAEHLGRECA
jgi:transposase